MIKNLAPLAFLLIIIPGWSREQSDSTKSKLQAQASLSLNSNGIAYIPAFSLDKPALIGAFSLRKGRFSYDPQLSYGLNLKPWIIDNWLHYRIMDRPDFELKAGAVISGFFSEYETGDESLLRVQKYLAVNLVTTYRFTPVSSMAFAYLIDRGQDPGTLSGHFFNIQADRSELKLGRMGLLAASLQLFYIDYTGDNDGLFTAAYISASLRKIPFSLFFQGIQPLWSNINPSPRFNWNLGLIYKVATPGF